MVYLHSGESVESVFYIWDVYSTITPSNPNHPRMTAFVVEDQLRWLGFFRPLLFAREAETRPRNKFRRSRVYATKKNRTQNFNAAYELVSVYTRNHATKHWLARRAPTSLYSYYRAHIIATHICIL